MNEWRVSRWINAIVLINLTSANMRSHYALWLNTISYLKFPLWYRWDVPYTFTLQPTGIKGEIKCPHLTGADENSIVIEANYSRIKKNTLKFSLRRTMDQPQPSLLSQWVFSEKIKGRKSSCLGLFLYSHGWTLLEIIESLVGIIFTHL